MLDGRGVPPRSTARRTLVHGLKLGGDLLQGTVRGGSGDAGDQPDQPVIAPLARRPVQQFRLDDALGHQSPNRAAQPLHRPGGGGNAVQDAHDVAPGLGRPHPPHGRQPRVQLGQDALQMCGVAADADLADGVRVAGAQAGIAADTTATARRPQSGFGALGNQRPFELGDGAQHLQREHALWRGGVDRVA